MKARLLVGLVILGSLLLVGSSGFSPLSVAAAPFQEATKRPTPIVITPDIQTLYLEDWACGEAYLGYGAQLDIQSSGKFTLITYPVTDGQNHFTWATYALYVPRANRQDTVRLYWSDGCQLTQSAFSPTPVPGANGAALKPVSTRGIYLPYWACEPLYLTIEEMRPQIQFTGEQLSIRYPTKQGAQNGLATYQTALAQGSSVLLKYWSDSCPLPTDS